MKKEWIPQAVACCMLLWALNPSNPYGYYILLRWVCCGIFAYLALQAHSYKLLDWAWVLGITAAIYNPLVPVHLTREIWTAINLLTIGIAVVSVFAVHEKTDDTSASPTQSGQST